jgi:hypothetical protein
MHGIIASSQRTVDGTPIKEFNQKLRTSDQQNKNNSLDLLRNIKLNIRPGELCGNRTLRIGHRTADNKRRINCICSRLLDADSLADTARRRYALVAEFRSPVLRRIRRALFNLRCLLTVSSYISVEKCCIIRAYWFPPRIRIVSQY